MSYGAKALGQYTNYSVTYNNGQFFFYADSFLFSHNASWVPMTGALSSETINLDSQMMGATYSGVWFDSNQIYYNGSWRYVTSALTDLHPEYFGISGDGSTFVTWDRACSY
jgi:hypothetical protein